MGTIETTRNDRMIESPAAKAFYGNRWYRNWVEAHEAGRIGPINRAEAAGILASPEAQRAFVAMAGTLGNDEHGDIILQSLRHFLTVVATGLPWECAAFEAVNDGVVTYWREPEQSIAA